jgi:hypothetical protein
VCSQRRRNVVYLGQVVVRVFRTVARAEPLPVVHERLGAAVAGEPRVVAATRERTAAEAEHGRPQAEGAAHGRASAVLQEPPGATARHGPPAAEMEHGPQARQARARERPAAARWAEPLGLWKSD